MPMMPTRNVKKSVYIVLLTFVNKKQSFYNLGIIACQVSCEIDKKNIYHIFHENGEILLNNSHWW